MTALGIDVGGVITDCSPDPRGPRLANPDTYLQTPFIPGIVPAIRRLVTGEFGPQAHIVSKCDEATQHRTVDLLTKRDFFTQTGIAPDNVHFCLTRDAKAPIVRRLKLTHFIDNRLEVLSHMVGLVPHLYLFRPDEAEITLHARFLPYVHRVGSADELVAAILA